MAMPGGPRAQKTGSIYNFKREERRNSNPVGEWNDYEIRAVGQQHTVIPNGEVVNTFTGARNLAGYIGLQNHDAGSQVHFRYVRIKEIDTTPPATAATLDPAEPDGSAGWYTSPVGGPTARSTARTRSRSPGRSRSRSTGRRHS